MCSPFKVYLVVLAEFVAVMTRAVARAMTVEVVKANVVVAKVLDMTDK